MRRPRWYEFLPEAVLALGLGLFALTEPHAATSGLKSTRAIALMATVAVGWVLARLVMLKAVPWPGLRLVPFAIGALVILKVVVLPAYDNKTVIEALPTHAAPAPPVPEVEVTPGTAVTPRSTAPPAGPTRVRSGELRGIDHRASGTVAVYRQLDTSVVVGLEEFDIQPGPAYALYVVPGSDRQDLDGGTRLSKLRGNRGTQFYEVPAEVVVDGDAWTVLVWCETFDVPVANATPVAV